MPFQYGIAQIKGGRTTQEDFCCLQSPEGTVAVLGEGARQGSSIGPIVVALSDGMGGHAAGEVAAQIAGATFLEAFDDLKNAECPSEAMMLACEGANRSIASAILSDSNLQGMGATVVGLFSDGHRIWQISIGDSHLLLVRADEVMKLNQDHSMRSVLENMVEDGLIGAEEALSHPDRNALLSALTGGEIELIDEGGPFDLKLGDVLVAASDGIDSVEPQKLLDLLCDPVGDPVDLAGRIVSAAATDGGDLQDNTTVMVIKVE